MRRRLAVRAAEEVAITIVTVEEQLRGWLSPIGRSKSASELIRTYGRLHEVYSAIARFPILDFDPQAATKYNGILPLRTKVGTMDLRIAPITLANNALLISRNLRDFKQVPGLHVEDWTI